jgi:drug/metabolite transporter (DMT)-like permease
LVGALLVAAGAIGLANKGIFGKFLYARGLSFEAVVATRALLALPAFWLIGWWYGAFRALRGAPASNLLLAALAGFICYYLGAMANFYGLTLIDASIERVLLFSYPAIVVLAASVIARQWPSARIVVATVLTYIGIVLVVGVFSGSLGGDILVGAGFVLLSGTTTAFYFLVSERITRRIGSAAFTTVAMTAAASSLFVHFSLRHDWREIELDSTGWLIMLGLLAVATVMPLLCVAEGVRRIGAARAAVVSTVGPPATILIAALLLGERMTLTQIAGTALIIGGILVLELNRQPLTRPAKGPDI